ncbi:MAG TPA: UDP-2,3-diacylglucosamine diphosphatase [Burkholderiales bacterium]|nr:UDP-2,3-diacylglucosamine diphosphatase [Burkholderiales bacterium]
MRFSVFISDLHLASERPRIVEQFFALLAGPVQGAEALYVLGDLFEFWVGDDDLDDPLNSAVAEAFAQTAARGTAVHFMHGNRDLLVGAEFAKRAHARLLEDPTLVDLHGTPTLLMHGDTLCTDDTEYQKFRAYAHDPGNQARFLGQPVAARRAQVQAMRVKSESAKKGKTDEIMDVSEPAVLETLRKAGYAPRVIHGHTHRPARHVHRVDGHDCERWVLGDWYENGSYLRCDAQGCVSHVLAST